MHAIRHSASDVISRVAIPHGGAVYGFDQFLAAEECAAGGYRRFRASHASPAATTICRRRRASRSMAAGSSCLRDVDESGSLVVPWEIDGAGRLMGSSATLIERPEPYRLSVELARGKINQLRSQAVGLADGRLADSRLDRWVRSGRRVHNLAALRRVPRRRRRSACSRPHWQAATKPQINSCASTSIRCCEPAINEQPQLETGLGVRLNGLPPPDAAEDVLSACNTVSVPMAWRSIEPTESQYRWDQTDAAVELGDGEQPAVMCAGRWWISRRSGCPEWLWLWEAGLAEPVEFHVRLRRDGSRPIPQAQSVAGT